MLKSLKTAVVFFLAVGQSLTASQANAIGPTLPELKAFKKLNQRSAHQLPLWCNIGDIVKFKPETFPDGKVILTALADTDGPLNRILLGDGSELNGSISLQEPPIARPSQTEYPSLIAFMKSKEGILFLRRFSLMIGEKDHRRVLLDAHVKFDALGSDLALSQLNFQISVGLLNRLLVLEDPQNQVTLLYPLGVGGIDPGLITEGRVHILTPLFKNGSLHKEDLISKRSEPKYYRDYPFLPVTNSKGLRTPVGFHITILSDEDWEQRGPSYLNRGFDSHGCMRLRGQDLKEFYQSIRRGASDTVPVNVDYFIYNRTGPKPDGRARSNGLLPIQHPYPLNDRSYQVVTNVAKKNETPRYGRDPIEHLVLMNKKSGRPDYSKLVDFSADLAKDLELYESLEEVK